MMHRPDPQPAMTEVEADRRLSSDPRDILALLAKADWHLTADDLRSATAYYRAVLQFSRHDARISVAEVQRVDDTARWIDARYQEHLLESLDLAGFDERNRHPRLQKSLDILFGKRQRDPVDEPFPQFPNSYFYPDMDYVEFAETDNLPWAGIIADNFTAMHNEALGLLADRQLFDPYVKRTVERPQGDVHGLLEKDDWSTLHLLEKGEPVPERIARVPTSFAVLDENVPLCRIANRAPTMMYSLLKPKAHIPPHTGMLNVRFVCHLPLVVPPDCGIRVGTQTRTWKPGEVMIFDDTVEHEAWNDSAQNRLVLIFDVWRPQLSAEERVQIEAIFKAVDSF